MTKKRLIDVNKLIDFIDVGHLRNPGELCYSEVDVVNLLLHAPTVDDVAPVVHGRWIDAYPDIEPNPMFMYGICSECRFEQGISKYLKYCPNCGCRMDGGAD